MSFQQRLLHPHKLMVFAKVAELGNVTRAAEALYMTQPAVTNLIRQLEEHFAQKLIEKHGKQIVITDAGYVLAKTWPTVAQFYTDLDDTMQAYQRGDQGEIAIIMVSTAKYFMPRFISHFLARYPKVNFVTHIARREAILPAILDHDFTLGLITDPDYHPHVHEQRLSHNPLQFVVRKGHPLAKQKTVSFKAIAKQPFIIREQSALITQMLFRYFSRYKQKPVIAYEIDSTEAIKEGILASDAIALLPYISIERLVKQRLLLPLAINFPKSLQTNYWYLISRQDHHFSPISQTFVSTLCHELPVRMP